MAQSVVHFLESIDIADNQGKTGIPVRPDFDESFDLLLQKPGVADTGKVIVMRQMFQFHIGLRELGRPFLNPLLQLFIQAGQLPPREKIPAGNVLKDVGAQHSGDVGHVDKNIVTQERDGIPAAEKHDGRVVEHDDTPAGDGGPAKGYRAQGVAEKKHYRGIDQLAVPDGLGQYHRYQHG